MHHHAQNTVATHPATSIRPLLALVQLGRYLLNFDVMLQRYLWTELTHNYFLHKFRSYHHHPFFANSGS